MPDYEKTQRTTLKHFPELANYDQETIHAILDEGLVAYVAFAIEGKPNVIPMVFGRVGDKIYFHGPRNSRMLKAMEEGLETCINITLVDGLVLARSAFSHDMNYRSVVVYGKAQEVTDETEKLAGLKAIVEHTIPGRWEDCRQPNPGEFKAVLLLALPITEASAKINDGPPGDKKPDYDLPYWSGQIPLVQASQKPIDDPKLADGIAVPSYVVNYQRPHAKKP